MAASGAVHLRQPRRLTPERRAGRYEKVIVLRCSALFLVGSLLTQGARAEERGAEERSADERRAEGHHADEHSVAAPGSNGADALGQRLSWDVPTDGGCPDRAWAAARIRAALSSGPEALELSELTARVVIVKDEQGYQVDIQTTSGDGEGSRHVAGSSCVEVAEAATVIVALAIDARALAEESRAPPEPREPAPAEPKESPPAAESETMPPRYFARVLGAFDLGTLPRASAGIEAEVGVRLGRLALSARALYLPPVSAQVAAAGNVNAGGRFSALEATAVLCWNEAWSTRVWTDLCGGAGVGVLFAEGFGAEALTASVDPAVAVPFDASLGVKLTSVMSLWVGGGGRALAPRRAYAIENLGPIYTPEPLAVRAGAGFEIGW